MVWINKIWDNNVEKGWDLKIGFYFMGNKELMKNCKYKNNI